jgi:hypothetical protein
MGVYVLKFSWIIIVELTAVCVLWWVYDEVFLRSIRALSEWLPILYRNLLDSSVSLNVWATRNSAQWNLVVLKMYAGSAGVGAWRNIGAENSAPPPRYFRDDELLPQAGLHCYCSGPPAVNNHEVHGWYRNVLFFLVTSNACASGCVILDAQSAAGPVLHCAS